MKTPLEQALWALMTHARNAWTAGDRRALLAALNDVESTLSTVRELVSHAPVPDGALRELAGALAATCKRCGRPYPPGKHCQWCALGGPGRAGT